MREFYKKSWALARKYVQLEAWITRLPEYRRIHRKWKKQILEHLPLSFKKGTFKEYFYKHFKGTEPPLLKVLNYDLSAIVGRQMKRTLNEKGEHGFDLDKPLLPPLPNKLKLEINYRKNIEDITNELEELIKLIRFEYSMPQNRAQPDSALEFKALILRKLGLEFGGIQKRLMKEYKNPNPPQRDALRKKITRILEKFKTAA